METITATIYGNCDCVSQEARVTYWLCDEGYANDVTVLDPLEFEPSCIMSDVGFAINEHEGKQVRIYKNVQFEVLEPITL